MAGTSISLSSNDISWRRKNDFLIEAFCEGASVGLIHSPDDGDTWIVDLTLRPVPDMAFSDLRLAKARFRTLLAELLNED